MNKNKRLSFYFFGTISAIAFSFLITLVSSAQFSETYSESVSVITVPSNPKPSEEVRIILQSSLVNLADSNVVWSVNGRVLKRGKDARELLITVGEVGKTTDVEISIETGTLGTITKNVSFSPGGVEILYEAETYTPPFYKGKALPAPQSVINLFALTTFKTASGSAISPRDLIFTWKKNGTVDGTNSGRGKNTYRYSNEFLKSDAPAIEVAVSSPDYNVTGGASFRARSVDPEIIFYEQNPLRGVVLEHALLNTFFLGKAEATLVAYPFFFSTRAKENSNFSYAWSINGKELAHPGGSIATLTVRKPDGKGVSFISLDIENQERIFQSGNANIEINYEN